MKDRDLNEAGDTIRELKDICNEVDLLEDLIFDLSCDGWETNINLNNNPIFRTIDSFSEDYENNMEQICVDSIRELRDNLTIFLEEHGRVK